METMTSIEYEDEEGEDEDEEDEGSPESNRSQQR